jgi:hypothetical protein
MKTEDDPFDLEKFRLKPEDVKGYAGTATAPRARGRRRDQFTIVPKSWSDQLKAARYSIGNTYRLALHLLYQHWKNGGQAIALTNIALANAGIGPRAKWRAIAELERLKLIKVERRPRKSPRVTLLKT